MDAYETRQRYKPGPDFTHVNNEPLLDINLTDSTELWLIQWPLNQIKPDDFEGKELSLKLHRDKTLGTFDSSSGKSYEVVSVGAKDPDATVFLPSGSEATIVGKIARRVCLVRCPDPKELTAPRGLSTFALSNQNPKDTDYLGNTKAKYSTPTKSEVSKMTHGASHETQASAPKSGRGSTTTHKKKRNDGLSEGGSSHAIGTATESENQTSNSNLERSSLEKKKKKKKV